MELFLNLVWLTVASVLAGLWMRSGPRKGEIRAFAACCALFCAAVLLFPAISVSDDLASQTFTAEVGSSSAKWIASAANLSHSSQGSILPFVPGVRSHSIHLRRQLLPQVQQHIYTASFLLLTNVPGRAPPLFNLPA